MEQISLSVLQLRRFNWIIFGSNMIYYLGEKFQKRLLNPYWLVSGD